MNMGYFILPNGVKEILNPFPPTVTKLLFFPMNFWLKYIMREEMAIRTKASIYPPAGTLFMMLEYIWVESVKNLTGVPKK